MLTVHRVGEEAAERWDAYVHGHPESTGYHQWAWRRVIQNAFGHDCPYLMAADGDRVAGVLPLCLLSSRLFGRQLISLPFFNYGGPLADSPEVEAALLNAAADLMEETHADHVELRMTRAPALPWPTKGNKVGMVLELPEDADTLWNGFKAKLRSQIRKPTKEGLTARHGRQELVDAFYEVFARNMRDLGTPVYAKDLFSAVLEHCPESGICVVEHQGRPVGAGLTVGYNGRLEIPWASTVSDYNRKAPNMLLYWSVLKKAVEDGYHAFDFGRSTEGSGTHRFKAQWGARPHPFLWAYHLREGDVLPEINPDNPKYRLPILVWQKLPVALTKVIGPAIVRNLP